MVSHAFRGFGVGLCVLGWALGTAAPGHAAPLLLDRLEASVNSAIILKSDVDAFRRTLKLRAQLDPLFAGTTVAAKGDKASEGEIVAFLVSEKIIAQQFPVTDREVEDEINSIQNNNKIDRAGLRRALGEQGFSFEQYFELIRTSASKRNLIDRDIRSKVAVSEDDVKNYFYNHFSQAKGTARSYGLQIITVSTRAYKTPSAARDVARRAVQALRSGEAFDEVARRYGTDGTGDLGVVTEDQMSPLVREQLKKLKIGQTSDVFGGAAAGAFFIVRLNDIKSGEGDRFEKMKEEIRGQLVASEFQHQIQLWLERQRQQAFVHLAGEPATAGLPVAK
jgi:peptidyl-prolyl cis-trans isomerase SurA